MGSFDLLLSMRRLSFGIGDVLLSVSGFRLGGESFLQCFLDF